MTGNFGQSATIHRSIPDVLRVPDGNVLLLRAYDRGVLKYGCPVNATSKAATRSGDRHRQAAGVVPGGAEGSASCVEAALEGFPGSRALSAHPRKSEVTGRAAAARSSGLCWR
jgi:hypothetical protein